MSADTHPTPSSAKAVMHYVDSSTIVANVGRDKTGTDDGSMRDVVWKDHVLPIQDARHRDMNLRVNGVELVPSSMQDRVGIDFLDTRDVVENYYPACEALVRKCLVSQGDDDPAIVRAFDHNVRIMDSSSNGGNQEKDETKDKAASTKVSTKVQQPVMIVHGDYTAISAPRRLQMLAEKPKANDTWQHKTTESPSQGLLDDQVVKEAIEKGRRFAFVNVWRNIDPMRPVEDFPLACIDATTVNRSEASSAEGPVDHDLRTLQIHYTDRIGENYLVVHNPQHTWVYFDSMTIDEAMLIKQWDSDGGFAKGLPGGDHENEICTFCLHSAFDRREESDSEKMRKSIEVRCVVIY